jgi:steroid 5-alpha reductase family enzyme
MKNETLRSLLGVLLIMVIGAGVAFAGSQGGFQVGEVPIFALVGGIAFVIQWLVFIHAYLNQTEMYFDLTGSLTYISVALLALLLSPVKDVRSITLVGLVIIWAARLGSFLYQRIKAAGEDRRFRERKTSFARFLLTWTLQGLWVTFSIAAALAVITSQKRVEIGIFFVIGLLVWLAGFIIETIADSQKRAFKADPAQKGKFIQTGLWSWSRHPNYFGEIVLWAGIAIIAIPVLSGWQWVTMISPIFIYFLLTRISGVPMLEKQADERWGGQPDYEDYKNRTSVLVPLPPKGK